MRSASSCGGGTTTARRAASGSPGTPSCSRSFERIPDLAGGPIDVALVPVGGWGPRLSGGHLDPVRAVQACEFVGARVAVPIHWGTFHAPLGKHLPRGWMDRGGPEFLEALAEQGSPTRGVLLAPGEAHPL